MGNFRHVKNLEDILKGFLQPNEKVVQSEVSNLTSPGENYGSIMLRILVKIKNSATGTERTLDAVGKIVPEGEMAQEVYNIPVMFRNEYQFYSSIVPILDKFLKSKGFHEGADFAAPLLGGRLNLNNSECVDNDAIILMENLKTAGYIIGKKSEGLDIECAKVILDSFAKFHASGIALKFEDPQTFDRNFRPYFFNFVPPKALTQKVFKNLKQILETSAFSKQEIDRVIEIFQRDSRKKNISDQWGTLIHYDAWINNILVKYEGSKPVHSVIVDFQMFEYGTPQNDVMLFLFSSLQQRNFEQNVDILLEYYYEKFVHNINRLGIDSRTFTKASFDEQVKSAMENYEYFHSVWMSLPIMHEEFNSVEDLKSEDSLTNWSEEHIQKIRIITRLCFEKGWL